VRRQYETEVRTLTDIYNRYLLGKQIDLLSIDTEGFDLKVLQSIQWTIMRPTLIIIEFANLSQPDDISNFLEEHSYRQIKRMGCNALYESIL